MNPEVQFTRVGVQDVRLYPFTPGGQAADFDAAKANPLGGLNTLGVSRSSKNAMLKGGESVHILGSWETDRETKIKVSAAQCDLRTMQILLGGTLIVQPAAGAAGEVQYFAEDVTSRAGYFRLRAFSTNGDGRSEYIFAKLKVEGTIQFNLERDKVSDLDFEAVVVLDKRYVRKDGIIGATFEQVFSEDGVTDFHS